MNTTFTGRNFLTQTTLIVCAGLALVTSVVAEPRGTLPPWPEQTLGIWSFDQWYPPLRSPRAAIGIENAQLAESWSGYSLTRDLLALSPVAIPVTEPYSGKRNFTTAQGTVRFWFCPNWSSASKESTGPGAYARLLELVSLGSKESEVLYSLYLSPEGNSIYLSGQGVGGPTDFLKAEVNWQAGQWHLIALAYDEKQTTLFVDAVPVATGTAMPDVAQWKRDALGLVIGSDLAAANPAQGQFDEFCTFDFPLNADDLRYYWRCNGVKSVIM